MSKMYVHEFTREGDMTETLKMPLSPEQLVSIVFTTEGRPSVVQFFNGSISLQTKEEWLSAKARERGDVFTRPDLYEENVKKPAENEWERFENWVKERHSERVYLFARQLASNLMRWLCGDSQDPLSYGNWKFNIGTNNNTNGFGWVENDVGITIEIIDDHNNYLVEFNIDGDKIFHRKSLAGKILHWNGMKDMFNLVSNTIDELDYLDGDLSTTCEVTISSGMPICLSGGVKLYYEWADNEDDKGS